MADILGIAKNLISQLGKNAQSDYAMATNNKSRGEAKNKIQDIAMNMITAGITESPSTKVVTGIPISKNVESSMVPHVLEHYDATGKHLATHGPYESLRRALDIAKNYISTKEGDRLFPRAMQ